MPGTGEANSRGRGPAATLPPTERPAPGEPIDDIVRNELEERLAAHLRTHPELLPAQATVLVALSGGPDSTALLHLLHRLRPAWGWHIVAAHFDHGVRAGGQGRVERIRERLVPGDARLLVGRPEQPLQRDHATLRRARYDWLRSAAARVDASRIATGHQRDDQAETILFRILRGTGNRGLAGIPARRGMIVRPLLPFARHELDGWLAARDVEPLDDPSNRNPRYARTRIRHQLLPALEDEVADGVWAALLAVGRAATEVEGAMKEVAERVLASFERGAPDAWPVELRAEALRLAARRRGVRLGGSAARTAAEDMPSLTSGHGLDLGGGLRLERTFDRWEVRRAVERESEVADEPLHIEGPASGEGPLRLGGRRYRVRWGAEAEPRPGRTSVALHVRGDHYPLSIRGWKAGDRIALPGGSRKLGRLMSAARVPARERTTVPIVTDRDGRVLCLLREELSRRIDRDARGRQANFVVEVENVEDG